MNLFESETSLNILPKDGEVFYIENALTYNDAAKLFDTLLHQIQWKYDEVVLFGKHIITKRKTSWYGDKEYIYKYSGITRKANIWTKELLDLKNILEQITGDTYNSCLLNLYHDGGEGMSWHADNEDTLVPLSSIASLSLGATRKFGFKHIHTKETIYIPIEPGSILNMKGQTQNYWLHCLPKSTKVNKPRINLTFRKMID